MAEVLELLGDGVTVAGCDGGIRHLNEPAGRHAQNVIAITWGAESNPNRTQRLPGPIYRRKFRIQASVGESRGCSLNTNETTAAAADPWQGSRPECRLHSDSLWFQKLVRDYLGDAVRIVARPDAGPREAVLVDCIETGTGIGAARLLYPSHAVVGVLVREDAGRALEILASGADGVIALTDSPDTWRQCLHVVLGGGQWLGGPGLEVKLQHKYTSYDVAKSERHSGDVTRRTKLFVTGSVGDKVRK